MNVQTKPSNSYTNVSKTQVRDMFDGIAPQYDFLNHFLSLGIDILWRKKAIRSLASAKPNLILDVATGTGDFAIESLSLNPAKIIGIDISENMLAEGKKKIVKKNLLNKIELVKGDSENIPFEDNKFDAVIVAFGVRNFANTMQGLKEMNRVLKTGGSIVILEFSKPSYFPVKQLYAFYFSVVLPLLGRLVSKHKTAYTYLPESVAQFPQGEEFLRLLTNSGYCNIHAETLTFGIATIYTGNKC